MSKTVIILGGGVAGMSAAHELAERGFAVTVFEKQALLPGGKARSVPVENTGSGGGKPLPGEHGFRFFPGFYKHITHTMKRIPFTNPVTGKKNKKGVYDNLVECSQIMITRIGQPPIFAPGDFPRSLADLELIIHDIFHVNTGLLPGEAKIIAHKLWQLMTSCSARRQNEYEHIGWWEFTAANFHSDSYKTLFVNGITRTLVAARAETASTKTDGDIILQLLFNMATPGIRTDRILCGPTNETWLFPWLKHLQDMGVQYNFNSVAEQLEFDANQICGVWISQNGKKQKFTADYYLCSMPVERAAKLMEASPQIYRLDPCLSDLTTLAKDVAWMNGIQFYLSEDVSINKGHILLADTPWALTAISQIQFWKGFDISQYGDGDIKGIISVDVSNWDNKGLIHGPAKDCTKEQVIEEVWYQMKQSFNTNGQIILKDETLKLAHIDCDIIFQKDILDTTTDSTKIPIHFGSADINKNEEPLLVNQVDTWALRRESFTDIPNFFLAADYIKTYTDLATMEGANEAARRAVNNIIDASGIKASYCKIWNLHEPDWLLYYKWLDEKRYNKGLAWKSHEPWFGKILNWLYSLKKKK